MNTLTSKRTIKGLALFISIICLTPTSAQQPRPNVFDDGNRWLITGYFDASPVHQQAATQGICYLPYVQNGTHITGAWYSDNLSWVEWSLQSGRRSGAHAR